MNLEHTTKGVAMNARTVRKTDPADAEIPAEALEVIEAAEALSDHVAAHPEDVEARARLEAFFTEMDDLLADLGVNRAKFAPRLRAAAKSRRLTGQDGGTDDTPEPDEERDVFGFKDSPGEPEAERDAFGRKVRDA